MLMVSRCKVPTLQNPHSAGAARAKGQVAAARLRASRGALLFFVTPAHAHIAAQCAGQVLRAAAAGAGDQRHARTSQLASQHRSRAQQARGCRSCCLSNAQTVVLRPLLRVWPAAARGREGVWRQRGRSQQQCEHLAPQAPARCGVGAVAAVCVGVLRAAAAVAWGRGAGRLRVC